MLPIIVSPLQWVRAEQLYLFYLYIYIFFLLTITLESLNQSELNFHP